MNKLSEYVISLKKRLKEGYRITVKKELYASEVLERVFKELVKNRQSKQIIFSKRVFTIIADDSDAHRTRRGYMGYADIKIFQFNGRHWALAYGEAMGSYPARPYKNDIIAIEVAPDESVSAEKIAEKIETGIGFKNSLIIAKADGMLTVERTSFFAIEDDSVFYKMREYLEKIIPKFIAQKTKTSAKCISASDLRQVVTQPQRYKPELVEALAEIIPKILGK